MIFSWSVWQLTEEPLAPLLVHEVYTSCVCRHTTLGTGWEVLGHATPEITRSEIASEAILKQKLQQLHEGAVCK